MVFAIECVVACLVFTLALEMIAFKRREVFTNDYPPVVTDKLRQMHLVAETPPTKKSDIVRKVIACIVFAILFAMVLHFVNGIEAFVPATITAYLLWLVVDWYDFLFVDVLFAPFDKFYKMAQVSAFERSAVIFHLKGSLKGMVLGLIFAPLVGLFVMWL